MLPFADQIETIAKRHEEAGRLLNVLRYYVWLEQNGMSWDTVRGVADVTERERKYGRGGYVARAGMKNCYSFKLANGEVKTVRDVPFDADVIFNRKRA